MKFELFYPFKTFVITQKFGETGLVPFYNSNGVNINKHNGVDFYSPNIYVRATHDGVVTFAGEDGSGGLGVVIRTNEKYDYKDGQYFMKTIYWHLAKGTIRVMAGDSIKVGDIIAEQDNTGLSTGKHLHFGLKPIYQGEQDWQWFNLEQDNGVMGAIDPQPYFNGMWAGDYQILSSLIEQIRILLQSWIKKS